MKKRTLIPSALFSCVACMEHPEHEEVASVTEHLVTHKPAIVVAADPNGKAIPCATISSLDGDYTYVTDGSGVAAIYEPELMGKTMAFWVTHPDAGVFVDPNDMWANLFHVNLKEAQSLGDLTVIKSRAPVSAGTSCAPPVPYTAFLDASGNVPQGNALAKVVVVDSRTNLPLPAVSFVSPRRKYVSDNNGVVAIYENRFMNTSVSFDVSSDGYVVKSGVALTLTPGQSQTIVLDPQPDEIAQRLYRLTGANKMRDSMLFGDVPEAPLNADVLSQDGPMTAIHDGKVYWTFGDTTLIDGMNGRGTSATTDLAADPTKPLALSYVHQPGGSLQIAPTNVFLPTDPSVPADLPAAWPGGLVTLSDDKGEHLYSTFLLIDANYHHYGFDLGVYGGDTAGTYAMQAPIDESLPSQPGAHDYVFQTASGAYVFAENGTRYPATVAGITAPANYQTYTAFDANGKIARDTATQRILYDWQTQQAEITDESGLPTEEVLVGKMRSAPADSSAPHPVPVKSHARAFNAYRKRFVDVITEDKLPMDSTWYAEADTPMGPWVYSKRITGDGVNSQYNPVITPYSTNGGAQIFLAQVFGNAGLGPVLTPYYNYNILMYRLDLTDARLALPVPVYELTASTSASSALGTKAQVHSNMPAELPVPFFAYDQSAPGSVPAYLTGASCRAARVLKLGTQPSFPALFSPDFYVLPANMTSPPVDSVALYDFTSGSSHLYAVDGVATPPGYEKSTSPIARVFRNPISKVWFPVKEYLGELVADAGDDICAAQTSPGSGADVVLDASRTVVPGNTSATYTWLWSTSSTVGGVASGPHATVHLPAGTHVLLLVVQTADKRASVDKVVVDIAP